ncbi:hypothetical protein NL390_31180, partial [Klebsiella pneumoniae]|nr:hypothetical protein [Klebsiella pneumoniae]
SLQHPDLAGTTYCKSTPRHSPQLAQWCGLPFARSHDHGNDMSLANRMAFQRKGPVILAFTHKSNSIS